MDTQSPIPIENPDILRELDVFADVRRLNGYKLLRTVQPTYQLDKIREALPTYGVGLNSPANVAAISYWELINDSVLSVDAQGRKVALRLKHLSFRSSPTNFVRIFLIQAPFMIGAATTTLNGMSLDGARGPGGQGPASAGLVRMNNNAGYVNPTLAYQMEPVNALDFVLPADLVSSMRILPGQTLGMLGAAVNIEITGNVTWFEEPITQATRKRG